MMALTPAQKQKHYRQRKNARIRKLEELEEMQMRSTSIARSLNMPDAEGP
jgi:hypothetical protein